MKYYNRIWGDKYLKESIFFLFLYEKEKKKKKEKKKEKKKKRDGYSLTH